ncbi:MAG: arylamine N-acetyltransferase [Acetobacteraceae bacterium]
MALDLQAYLNRIGYRGDLAPTLDTLAGLLRAHMIAIPFEALDVLLGRRIRLDLDSVQAKLVGARRGGYCFEQATLFAAVLEMLGFRIERHIGRVVLMTPLEQSPRAHMFVTVDLPEGQFVADPGFGGPGTCEPLPLSGEAVGQHRLGHDGGYRVLLNGDTPLWYAELDRVYPVDFEMANHCTATHPDSPFLQRIMIGRVTPNGRIGLMNREATFVEGDSRRSFQLEDRAALRSFLMEHFGIDLPEVETLRVPLIPEWT